MKIIKKIKDLLQGKSSLKDKRSKEWPRLRNTYLQKHPKCALCGSSKKVEVHHIKPFNLYPELELKISNLISLCENKKYGVCCHLLFGHLGNYRKINNNVIKDVKIWSRKIKE